MEHIHVQTKQGTVSGKMEGRFYTFQGIPYGKAERFRRPEACSWNGVLDCTGFGKKAPQLPDPFLSGDKPEPKENFGEDCLNLNIYTPDVEGNLPVLVDIHGGAFQNGSNQEKTPDQIMENKDFVYVSINYRLGIFGYLYLGEYLGEEYRTSGNNGLMDQMLALSWVHENIRSFGGDPSRVTVMGASAGAKSIAAMMILPESRSYFSQVLLSSGAYQCIRSRETAAKVAEAYMKFMDTEDPSGILDVDMECLLEAQKKLCSERESTCIFGPTADGIVIPYNWEEVLHSGRYWSGRALVGSCRNELIFYQLFDREFLEHAPKIAEGLFGLNAVTAKEDYEKLYREASGENGGCSEEKRKEIWVKVLSDYMYRMYSSRLAKILERNGSHVYKYSMEYEPAIHCLDQSFAFGTKDGGDLYRNEETREERLRFGHLIFEAYTNFILTGDPNGEGVPEWPEYREGEFIQMCWNSRPEAVPEPDDDTLNRFPEQVFRLV